MLALNFCHLPLVGVKASQLMVKVIDLRFLVSSMSLSELLTEFESVIALFDVVVESTNF